jgi:hypothetical protein
MKTSILFTLLFAAAAVMVTGCQNGLDVGSKSGPWQSKIDGVYVGIISNFDEYPSKTTLTTKDGNFLAGSFQLQGQVGRRRRRARRRLEREEEVDEDFLTRIFHQVLREPP